jgi:hypothetical protein
VLDQSTVCVPSHRSVAVTMVVVAKRHKSKNTFFIMLLFKGLDN